MVNENNKFIPKAPEQYTVCELKDQQVKKSPLSAAARSKVVNRTGSNYISSWAETEISEPIGYGPVHRSCPRCSSNRDVSENTHKCPSCGAFFSKVAEEHEKNLRQAQNYSGCEATYNYTVDSNGNVSENVKFSHCLREREKRSAWLEGYWCGETWRMNSRMCGDSCKTFGHDGHGFSAYHANANVGLGSEWDEGFRAGRDGYSRDTNPYRY